ncbi:MAG: hypothetical protein EHM46_02205, partial [Bacteroidetes bacterium]
MSRSSFQFRSAARALFTVMLGSLVAVSCEKTEPGPESDLLELTDYDGNTYYAKKIGEQWWMVN